MEVEVQLTDLVEKESTPVSQLEEPLFETLCIGESTSLVPEQFALQKLFGNGRAIQNGERLGSPVALIVESLGDQVLSGATFSWMRIVRA